MGREGFLFLAVWHKRDIFKAKDKFWWRIIKILGSLISKELMKMIFL